MPELPVVTARQVVRTLQQMGFTPVRQRGSHRVMSRGNRLVVVPMHRGDFPPGTLRSILRQAGISVADFVQTMKRS